MPRSPSPTPGPLASSRSTILNHSIAPFYACYLLRSLNPKRSATYIGSTPDPPRRIREHNGQLKGGAYKTRSLRPWEQEMIVYNFPTKLQALQFEWAWQNPDRSRLVKREGAGSNFGSTGTSKSKGKGKAAVPSTPPKTNSTTKLDGRTKAGRAAKALIAAGFSPPPSPSSLPANAKRSAISTSSTSSAVAPAQFPRTSLSNRPLSKTQVLQYMLTVPPWSSFPLRVLLFSREAREWWDLSRSIPPLHLTDAGRRKWLKDRQAAGRESEDPWGEERGKRLDQVVVSERWEGVDGERLRRAAAASKGAAGADSAEAEVEVKDRIRVDDDLFFDPHWAKWNDLLASTPGPQCGICGEKVDVKDHLSFALCTSGSPLQTWDPLAPSPLLPPPSTCHAVHHLPCLSTRFTQPSPAPPASSTSNPLAAPPLVPTTGHCPSCAEPQHWQDLLRGAYRRKEEQEGRRKKRVGVRRAKEQSASVEGEDGGEEDGGRKKAVKRKRKAAVSGATPSAGKTKGKAKGKARSKLAASGADFDSNDSEAERFDLSDLFSSSDLDLDLQQQEEERERAFARSGTAGPIEEQDEAGYYDAAEEEEQGEEDAAVLFYAPTQAQRIYESDEDDLPPLRAPKSKKATLSRLAFTSSKPSTSGSASISAFVRKLTVRARVVKSPQSRRSKVRVVDPPVAVRSGSGKADTGEGTGKEMAAAYIEISDSD